MAWYPLRGNSTGIASMKLIRLLSNSPLKIMRNLDTQKLYKGGIIEIGYQTTAQILTRYDQRVIWINREIGTPKTTFQPVGTHAENIAFLKANS